ncbi:MULTISPECIES: substrate-binding domain-containing protein [unclassified Pseudomonas]|jgi:molybdate transport system substrate-binding protein|uniref:molybdate ABC transporter substrate-binding protein n=1 Tax=unclassified Pseudomonas TaxID=196821 RepID=UPI000C2F872C|nr:MULTISPECIES: substrate-binding domain-containing protein [unclassified Pseudomonas]MCU1741998.1 substrate-binding domain-containing protein [Pseudomonas sp. 20S_6.2_Bac1]
MKSKLAVAVFLLTAFNGAQAAEIKVLTTGAFKPVLLAIAPELEASKHIALNISNGTAGELNKRIESGEKFDVAILTDSLVSKFEAAGSLDKGTAKNVAKVGIGVAVPLNAPKPVISTVNDFKSMLHSEAKIAYIDPKSGGSSGIYLTGLFDKLGVSEEVARKAVLVKGGLVGTKLVDGEASVAIHQISELLAVPGIQFVGALPAEIQSYTTYTAAMAKDSRHAKDSLELIKALGEEKAVSLLQAKGME